MLIGMFELTSFQVCNWSDNIGLKLLSVKLISLIALMHAIIIPTYTKILVQNSFSSFFFLILISMNQSFCQA